MKYLYRHILVICLIVLIAHGNVFTQKVKKKTTRIRVEYFKDHTKTETLVATLKVKEKRYNPLSDVIVLFYFINDTSNVLLDKIRTNAQGEAIFVFADNPKVFKDSLGIMTFVVEYNGSTSLKGANRKIDVKQANLDVSFSQKDTVKYIEVDVNAIDLDNQMSPISGLNILFYIKGTFSLLNIGKEKTNENGKVEVEFPIDMPGDTVGVLTIVVKIEEDKLYGTIESRGTINWGIPVPLVQEKHRGLGDTDAPLWMVYTLITLLSAVWFHYLYVILMIVKIKMAKKSY